MPKRARLLPKAIVGVTCHDSRHLAMEAGEAGADYVAFGAFFPTQTKEPKTQADIELLRWWAEIMVVPCVAIGGITIANAPAADRSWRRFPRRLGGGVGTSRRTGRRGAPVQRAVRP